MPINNVVKGNLVTMAQEGAFQAIVHGCNIFHTMGAGIAPQIAKAFPLAEQADFRTDLGSEEKLGTYSVAYIAKSDVTVINAYTQAGYTLTRGEHNVDYLAIAEVFALLNKRMNEFNAETFTKLDKRPMGIPMIGAGLAGGHWEAIETIINLVTPNLDITLVEYAP